MVEADGERVTGAMFRRPVPVGPHRPDRLLESARAELSRINRLRAQPRGSWPAPAALPEALHDLAELLLELTWDDLALLAYREEAAVYRTVTATAGRRNWRSPWRRSARRSARCVTT